MNIKLGEIFSLQMGKTPSRSEKKYWSNGKYDWVSIADLSRYETYVESTKEKISQKAVDESGIKLVPPNTVIMSFKLSIGKTAITRENTYTNEAIMAFIPRKSELVCPSYFFHLFRGLNWDKVSNRAVMGSTLNKSSLSQISISLPLVEEQKRIARLFDSINTIIVNCKKQLTKLDELVKSRFIELFGNPENKTAKWPLHMVDSVAMLIDPQPSHRTPPVDTDGVPYISIKDCDYESGAINFEFARKVNRQVLLEQKARFSINKGDFIIGKIGTIGNPIFVPENKDYTLSANVILVQPNHQLVDSHFLKMSFMSDFVLAQFQKSQHSTSQAAFGIQKVRNINVMNPPIKVQKEFSDFAYQVDKSKLAIQKSLDELEILKKSLMQKYFG